MATPQPEPSEEVVVAAPTAAPDPLAAALAWMAATPAGAGWVPALPDPAQLPDPLRYELARFLATVAQKRLVGEKSPLELTPVGNLDGGRNA